MIHTYGFLSTIEIFVLYVLDQIEKYCRSREAFDSFACSV